MKSITQKHLALAAAIILGLTIFWLIHSDTQPTQMLSASQHLTAILETSSPQ